mmetsp:Transcript_34569/g.72914  ORF Transcript_34569/g.72914 Transcript_34569/m.72914 type:complete len:128 (-) Transcript_34569:1244-1627(-)
MALNNIQEYSTATTRFLCGLVPYLLAMSLPDPLIIIEGKTRPSIKNTDVGIGCSQDEEEIVRLRPSSSSQRRRHPIRNQGITIPLPRILIASGLIPGFIDCGTIQMWIFEPKREPKPDQRLRPNIGG